MRGAPIDARLITRSNPSSLVRQLGQADRRQGQCCSARQLSRWPASA